VVSNDADVIFFLMGESVAFRYLNDTSRDVTPGHVTNRISRNLRVTFHYANPVFRNVRVALAIRSTLDAKYCQVVTRHHLTSFY
jgi:hypothetical protein